jgi:8-oxo-dGTP pyrophosphatase MutT (NUDIX family)
MPAPPEREQPVASVRTRTLRPRDAATLIVVDRSGGEPRILMGRRRPDQVFLPDKYVFPGGRVDRADLTAPASDELAPLEVARLLYDMKGRPSPARVRALALAAVRETFEETGIVLGRAAHGVVPRRAGSWSSFHATGHLPALSGLTFLARAITPPGRPRRYDTRFFAVEAREIAMRGTPLDEELAAVDWFTIDAVRRLDLPNITRAVVEDVADRLQQGGGVLSSKVAAIPYYCFTNGTFCRRLITATPA